MHRAPLWPRDQDDGPAFGLRHTGGNRATPTTHPVSLVTLQRGFLSLLEVHRSSCARFFDGIDTWCGGEKISVTPWWNGADGHQVSDLHTEAAGRSLAGLAPWATLILSSSHWFRYWRSHRKRPDATILILGPGRLSPPWPRARCAPDLRRPSPRV